MPLSDLELLAKYELADPLADAYYFARLVDALARRRRANLSATITYKQGEYVDLTYRIEGFDSEGQSLLVQTDSGAGVLASCIRLLNQRYASRRNSSTS